MEIDSSTIKRRRTLSNDVQKLVHLPDDQLVNIAAFLPKTSQALFAVALTAPSKAFRLNGWKLEPNATSKAIISSTKPSTAYVPLPSDLRCCLSRRDHLREVHFKNESYGSGWEVLDLVDIEFSLVEKLSDDDIGAMLVVIDAKNTLKKCRLTRCPRLSGSGLEPLRNSTSLELIDINRFIFTSVSYQNKKVDSWSIPVISSILESIIDMDGNSLRQVSLPRTWREGKARNERPLHGFLEKFNEMLLSEDAVVCCARTHSAENDDAPLRTCFTCFKCVCNSCNRDQHGKLTLQTCDHCSMILCTTCDKYTVCHQCDSAYCSLCAKEEDVDAATHCTNRNCSARPTCVGCKLKSLDDLTCLSCRGTVVPKLIGENRQLRNEIDDLRKQLRGNMLCEINECDWC